MSPSAESRAASDELQFETVVTDMEASPGGGNAPTCAECATAITTEYFSAASTVVCSPCRGRIETRLAAPVGAGGYARAVLFGLGAAAAGALLWFGVAKLTGYEIGLIAIAVGFLVGRAVQLGARGRGSRRCQAIAVTLTWVAIGSAYLAFAMDERGESAAAVASATADSAAVAAPIDSASSRAAADSSATVSGPASVAVGLAALAGLVMALPLIASFGDLPGSLLSALIIGIGLQQAWSMNRRPRLTFEGPFRVGGSERADA